MYHTKIFVFKVVRNKMANRKSGKGGSTDGSAKIDWSKYAGKAARGAKVLFEPIAPVTVNSISNTANALRDFRAATISTKSVTTRQKNAQKNSPDSKKAFNLFKSASDAISSGSFDMESISNDLFDDYESDTADAFKMPTGDEAVEMSSEEILLLGNKGVAQSVIQSGSAQLRGLQESSKALIRSNVKSTQALALSINNTLNYGFSAINTNLTIQNRKLDNINRSLSNIMEFNNSNALEFYTKSIDMLNGIGKMLENYDKTLNPPLRSGNKRKLDFSGGFDPREYMNYVKEGFMNSFLGTGAQLVGASAKENVKDYGVAGLFKDFIVPKAIKEPLEKFDKSVNRALDEGFKMIYDKLNKNLDLSFLGLGNIFGVKRSELKGINMASFAKDAMPWNGIAQKTLVEVIPELLTSIDSKLDKTEKRYYDYSTGQFKNKSTIEKEYADDYFDTIAMTLSATMDKLTEVAKKTGRTDTDALVKSFEALIDDQLAGDRSTINTRKRMASKMRNFGIDNIGIREVIQEYTSSIEEAIDKINEKSAEIGATDNIYRNINNTYGKMYGKDIKKMHRSHTRSYSTFSFTSLFGFGDNVDDIIKNIQEDYGLPKVDLSDNTELKNTVKALMQQQAKTGIVNKQDIVNLVSDAASSKATAEAAESKFKIFKRFKAYKEKTFKDIERKTTDITNDIMDPIFDNVYMRDTRKYNVSKRKSRKVGKHTASVKGTVGKATTRMSNNKTQVPDRDLKAFEQINDLNNQDYDKYLKKSESENDRDHRNMLKAFDDLSTSPAAATPQGVQAQTENKLMSFLSGLMANFKAFTSRLFGKEGFFKKMWDSEYRKKMQDKIKKKLFTGEDAIFKDQYKDMKAWWSDTKRKTKEHLGKGYDYVYDNTMQYLYGEEDENGNKISYKDNEKYKKNTFLSQTMNREWRAEQRRKREEEKRVKEIQDQMDVFNIVRERNGMGSIPLSGSQTPLLPGSSAKVNEPKNDRSRMDIIDIMPDDIIDITPKEIKRGVSRGKHVKSAKRSGSISASVEEARTRINNALISTSEASENLEKNMNALVVATVGEIDESPQAKAKSFKQDFWTKLKATIPKAMAAGIAGAGVGLLNSKFSLLGSMFLPGGPVAGAIVGSGLAILSQTEAFKTFMFGQVDKDGNREGGLISKQMRDKFHKMAPYAIGGAVLGGIKGFAKSALGFNSGLGVLGMQILPGGILGGAMLGAGLGILKNSESFKKMLFGEKGEDGKRHGKLLSDSFNKAGNRMKKLFPYFKSAGKGLAIGALTGTVLSHMGYIPAMLSMGGPVGMGMMGLGLGIAASTKKFNTWMFGSEQLDENGNKTGKRNKDGFLNRAINILKVNTIEPIAESFKNNVLNLVDWTKEKITYPFRLAFGSVLSSLADIKDNVVDFVKDKFETVGNGIMHVFKSTMRALFSPLTKVVGFIGKSAMGVAGTGAKIAMSPLAAGLQIARVATAPGRFKDYKEYYKNYYGSGILGKGLRAKWAAQSEAGKRPTIFNKMSDVVGTLIGQGEVADAFRSGWNDKMTAEGKNVFNWRNVGEEERNLKEQRKQRNAEAKQWKKIDKYRRNIIKDDLGGREVTLNDYAFNSYKKKFMKLGIGEEFLQSSDDIMDLLYRRPEFKNRMNGKERHGLMIAETPEQKKSREATEAYQKKVMDALDFIKETSNEFAQRALEEKYLDSQTKKQKKDKRKFRNRVKKRNIKGINFNDPALQDYDLGDIDNDILDQYMYSDEYDGKSHEGFMRFLDRMNITKKSKFRGIHKDAEVVATPTSAGASVDNKKPMSVMEVVKDQLGKLNKTAETQKEMASAQLEISSGGELDDDAVVKKKGKSFGSRIMSKFNPVMQLLNFRKKKDKADKESKESEEAREGTDSLIPGKEGNNGDEEDGALTPYLKKLKALGHAFGETSIGSFLIKGMKFMGSIGLLGTIGFTIAELIRPGTADKVGASIDAFSRDMKNGEFSFKKVFTNAKLDFDEWFDNTFIGHFWNESFMGKFWNGTVTPWFHNTLVPAVDKLPEIILTKLPAAIEKTGEFIGEHTEQIVNAVVAVVTKIGVPLANAIAVAMPQILPAILTASGTILSSIAKTIVDMVFGKDKSKGDLSKEEVAASEAAGKNVRQEKVASVKAINEADAYAQAKSSYGLNNPVIEYNPETDEYEISEQVELGENMAVDHKTGQRVKISKQGGALRRWLTGPIARGFIGKAAGKPLYMKAAKAGTFAGITLAGKALSGIGKTTGKIGKGIFSLPGKLVGGFTDLSGKALSTGAKVGKNASKVAGKVAESAEETGAKIVELAQKGAEAGKEAAENATAKITTETAEETIKKGTEKSAEKVGKETSDALMKKTLEDTMKTVRKALQSLADNATVKAAIQKEASANADNVLSKIIKKMLGCCDDIVAHSAKHLGKIVDIFTAAIAKFTAKTGLAVSTAGTTEAAMVLAGGVFGAINAANLFEVDHADYKMRIVSGIIEALLSTAVGTFFDAMFVVFEVLFNWSFKKMLAEAIYKMIGSETELNTRQDNLATEANVYNALNKTNLTSSNYNAMRNMTVGDKIINTGKKILNSGPLFKGIAYLQGKENFFNVIDSGNTKKSKSAYAALSNAGYSNTSINEAINNGTINSLLKNVGYGENDNKEKEQIHALYSQKNNKWAGLKLGKFENGSISTMATGGCGPTALAAVVNMLNTKGKEVTPKDIANYATRNGYISQGGANAGLFTDGAMRLGLTSNQINNDMDLRRALKSGVPVIISGTSTSNNDPFTKAGHIVVATGWNNEKTTVLDPLTGKTKEYNVNTILSKYDKAWSYEATNKVTSTKELNRNRYRINKKALGYGPNYDPQKYDTTIQEYADDIEEGSKKYATSKANSFVSSEFYKIQNKVIKSIINKFTKAVNYIGEEESLLRALERLGLDAAENKNVIQIITEFFLRLINMISNYSSRFGSKIIKIFAAGTTKLGAKVGVDIATGGLSEVAFTALGAISTVIDADNLFGVSDPDWLMRGIALVLGAVLGSSLCFLLTICIDIIVAITTLLNKPRNPKAELAKNIYKEISVWFVRHTDKKAKKLDGSQIETGLDDAETEDDLKVAMYNTTHKKKINKSEYIEANRKNEVSQIKNKLKSGVNKVTKKLFGKNVFNVVNTKSTESALKKLKKKGYTEKQLLSKQKKDPSGFRKLLKQVGYGPDDPIMVNGLYSQSDPRWGGMPIGMLPNGTIATMDRAGCGPTALAAVANTVKDRQLGYGEITPADMGAYAASNGYISQGGANAGLFTEGAEKLGLNSREVNNSYELRDNLMAGKPTILTGTSSGTKDPFTKVGHIVMADGLYGDKTSVLDPITGKRKLYSLNDISKSTEHAWAYGYGKSITKKTSGGAYANADKYQKSLKTGVSRAKKTLTNVSKKATASAGAFNNTVNRGVRGTTKTAIMSVNAGIKDFSASLGYHTGPSGIDVNLMEANYRYFIAHDKYYHKNHAMNLSAVKKYFPNRKTRLGTFWNRLPLLAYILTTQYFPLNKSLYGIGPQKDSRGNYKQIHLSNSIVTKIYNAAVKIENNRGFSFVSKPLTEIEMLAALGNGLRVMYGLANTLRFFANKTNWQSYAASSFNYKMEGATVTGPSVGDADNLLDPEIVDYANAGADGTGSSGITSLDQLKQLFAEKNALGKIALLGKMFKAHANALMNGTDFWMELTTLLGDDGKAATGGGESNSTGGSSGTKLTGVGVTLAKALSSPDNIQEELLGKSIEAIYRGESGGNYASVITDTNGLASVGPYQANGPNAVALLKELSNTPSITADARKKFGTYANIISNSGKLNATQKQGLIAALSDSANSNAIKRAIDKNAFRFHHWKYRDTFSKWYDNGTIKDLRSLVMLDDMANIGPGYVTSKRYKNSFISHWSPVDKSKDFEAVYNTLKSPNVKWGASKGYVNRINTTHDSIKGYTFKHAVEPGKLSYYFANKTNPMGFGPSESYQRFNSGMNAITNVIIKHLASNGINIGDSISSGLSSDSSNDSISNSGISLGAYNGQYNMDDGALTSISGTDRDRFVAVAKSQVGYLEKANGSNLRGFKANPGHNNYTKYAQEIGGWNGPGAEWCQFFTSWAGKAAGIPQSILKHGGSCQSTLNQYKQMGVFHPASNYNPQAGDIVYFNWNKTGRASHVGIVTGVSGNNVLTIEGNTTMKGSKAEGVESKTRSKGNGIIGYIHPKWTGEKKTVNPSKLLKLGYGPDKANRVKIESPYERETKRKPMNSNAYEFSPQDLAAVGFGPGMVVDAGFDMTNTDSKLEQIARVITEWFADSKKKKAAESSETTNVNVIKTNNTTNVVPNQGTTQSTQNVQQYKRSLLQNHLILSAKKNIRNTL